MKIQLIFEMPPFQKDVKTDEEIENEAERLVPITIGNAWDELQKKLGKFGITKSSSSEKAKFIREFDPSEKIKLKNNIINKIKEDLGIL